MGLAFALLITCFVRSDMSVALVVENSHSMKPLLYKFAGTWGNHEGSMLLWVAVLGVSGAAVAIFEHRIKRSDAGGNARGTGTHRVRILRIPALRLEPVRARQSGACRRQRSQPAALQDPGLAFHPPTLYLGYVGMSVAFSLAVGALVTRDVDRHFARAMRPWVLGAWIFLTLGITGGSYWAYYELGWGGWWFWDPVENASLMPWLAATALLHSVTVLATRDGLRAWTIMLAVIAFSMSDGRHLPRPLGHILTSVHSFAVDPTRGSFLLALLALYIGGAMVLFAVRIATVREGSQFELVSREGALVANNLILSAILGVVLIGTLYPLFIESLTGDKLSVGPPYFDATAGPLALLARRHHGARPRHALAAGGTARRADPCSLADRGDTVDCCCRAPYPCSGHFDPVVSRHHARDRSRCGEPRAALGSQPASHAALHIWHGPRASRHRGRGRGDGEPKRLREGNARRQTHR